MRRIFSIRLVCIIATVRLALLSNNAARAEFIFDDFDDPVEIISPENDGGDADGDGDTDGDDFLVWQSQFGMAAGDAAGYAAVPESAGAVIAGLMLCVAITVRRFTRDRAKLPPPNVRRPARSA